MQITPATTAPLAEEKSKPMPNMTNKAAAMVITKAMITFLMSVWVSYPVVLNPSTMHHQMHGKAFPHTRR